MFSLLFTVTVLFYSCCTKHIYECDFQRESSIERRNRREEAVIAAKQDLFNWKKKSFTTGISMHESVPDGRMSSGLNSSQSWPKTLLISWESICVGSCMPGSTSAPNPPAAQGQNELWMSRWPLTSFRFPLCTWWSHLHVPKKCTC